MTRQHKNAFLAALATCGNTVTACKLSGVARPTVYLWRHKDPQFEIMFGLAEQEAVEHLEAEARRRAVEGIEERGYDREGNVISSTRKYSDLLLIFLLKGVAPEKYRERQDINLQSSSRLRIDVNDGSSGSG